MSEELWKTLITNLPAILSAVAGIIAAIGVPLGAYWAYRAQKLASEAKMQSTANAAAIKASDEKTDKVLEAQNAQDKQLEKIRTDYAKLGDLENQRAKEAPTLSR